MLQIAVAVFLSNMGYESQVPHGDLCVQKTCSREKQTVMNVMILFHVSFI